MNNWHDDDFDYLDDDSEEERLFKESMEQLKEDSKHHDFSLNKDWDADFRNVLNKEIHKKRVRKQVKKLSLVASIVLMVMVGVSVTQREVIGECINEIFNNKMIKADSEFEFYGTNEELTIIMDEENTTIYYDEDTLTKVYTEVREDIKRPIFQMKDDLGEYEITTAYYKKDYNLVVVELKTSEGKIFVSQKEVLDNRTTGGVSESDALTVWNENLQQYITINKSVQDESYSFSVQNGYAVFKFYGYVCEEMCCEIAENLAFE